MFHTCRRGILVPVGEIAQTKCSNWQYITGDVFKWAQHSDTVMGNRYGCDCGPGKTSAMMDGGFRPGQSGRMRNVGPRGINEVYKERATSF